MYTQYLRRLRSLSSLLMVIIGAVILVRRLNQPQLELVIEQELEQAGKDNGTEFGRLSGPFRSFVYIGATGVIFKGM
jgi:hypothetical protein